MALLILTTAPLASAVAAPAGCLTEVPNPVADALMNRTIAALGQSIQTEILKHLLAGGDLRQIRRATLEHFMSLGSEATDPSRSSALRQQPEPESAFIDPLALPLTDYRWFGIRGELDDAGLCPLLELRSGESCGGQGADVHNLVVLFLRNRQGLCGGPVQWRPAPDAPPRIRAVAAVVAAPAYYGTLESWLENGRDESFRLAGNFFNLLYMDYLRLAYSHRQVNFALSEFLTRRTDLHTRYPGLDPLRAQLGRLRDMGLIE